MRQMWGILRMIFNRKKIRQLECEIMLMNTKLEHMQSNILYLEKRLLQIAIKAGCALPIYEDNFTNDNSNR